MAVLKNVWSSKEVVDVKELNGNLYAISFVGKKSMEKQIEEGHWSVMGCYLNLKRWEVDKLVQKICFSKVIFWIQIHKLPLELMTIHNARKIGSVLGELRSVEDPIWASGVGKSYLRIRVEIETEKPLMGGFWVLRGNKGKVWAEVKYEKITDFYFGCGRLGQVLRFCEERGEQYKEGDRKRFGIWMKAAPVKVKEEDYG